MNNTAKKNVILSEFYSLISDSKGLEAWEKLEAQHVELFTVIAERCYSLNQGLPNYMNERLDFPDGFTPTKDQVSDALRPKYEKFINHLLQLCIFAELRSKHDFSYSSEKLSYGYSHSFNYVNILNFSEYFLGNKFYKKCMEIYASLFKNISDEIFLKKDEKIQFLELTPLMFAILEKNLSAMKILLNSDVDPNQIGKLNLNLLGNSKDITPLELAVLSQSKDCVKILIEYSADVSDKCIQIALLKQNIDIYKALSELRPVSSQLIIDTFQKSSRDVKIWFFQSEILNEEETKMCLKKLEWYDYDWVKNLDCVKENRNSLLQTDNEENVKKIMGNFLSGYSLLSPTMISHIKNAMSQNKENFFFLIWNMYSTEDHKRFINTLQFEYLSILNTILNVIISILPWIYYSLTKGYQQITPHDLRFFAFGEKQKLEKFLWDHSKLSTP